MNLVLRQRAVDRHPGSSGRPAGPRGRFHRLSVVLPVAVLALLLPFLGRTGLWRDEVFTLTAASKPPSVLWAMVTTRTDAAEALYELALLPLARLTEDPWVLRAPSWVGAAVAVAAVAVTARRLCGPRAALVAGGVLVADAAVWEYAAQARPYGLVLGAVALVVLLVTTSDLTRPRTLVALAVLAAVAVHLQALSALVLVAVGLAVLVVPGYRPVRWRVLAALAAAALACAPLAVLVSGQQQQTGWIPLVRGPEQVLRAGMDLLGGRAPLAALLAVVVVAGGAAAVAAAARGRASTPAPQVALLVVAAVLPVLLLVAVGTVAPLLLARYLLGVLPAVAVLVGVGLARAPRGVLAAALAVLAVLAATSFARVALPTTLNDDPRAAAAFIAANDEPGDVVVYSPTWLRTSVGHYLARTPGAVVDDVAAAPGVDLRQLPDLFAPELPAEQTRSALEAALARGARVWVVGVEGSGRGYQTWAPTPNTSAEVLAQVLPQVSTDPGAVLESRDFGDQRVALVDPGR